jgi:hypothetical protein
MVTGLPVFAGHDDPSRAKIKFRMMACVMTPTEQCSPDKKLLGYGRANDQQRR